MNRVLGTYRQGRIIADLSTDWPDGSRVEISLLTPSPQASDRQDEPPPGVRVEFLDAINDPNRFGLEESLWPQTPGEREIWLKWFDSREPLDLSPEEREAHEGWGLRDGDRGDRVNS